MKKEQKFSRSPSKLIILYLLITAFILINGIRYYYLQKEEIRNEAYTNLSVIAELKAKQIFNWRNERIGDANVIFSNKVLITDLKKWFDKSGNTIFNNTIISHFLAYYKFFHYKDIILFDSNASVKYSIDEKLNKISKKTFTYLKKAEADKKPVFSEIYLCDFCNDIHLDIVIPLFEKDILFGGIILRIDPYEFLFPLIQSWPTKSESSETLLITKEGDEVVYLNELRHQKNTALILKFKIDSSNYIVPSVMAVMGKTGLVEGLDYRGISVLADIRKISDSPWYMIAKVDLDEIYAPVKEKAINVSILISLILISFAIGFVWVWTNQKKSIQIQHLEEERKHKALIRHFDYIVKYANDIFLLTDGDLNIVEVNDRAVQVYGYTREEMLKLNDRDLREPETLSQLYDQIKIVKETDEAFYETIHKRKNGSTFPVEASLRIVEIEGKNYYQAIIRDITERKKAEESLKESEEKFRSLFENAILGIYRTTPEGKIIDCNPALFKMLGFDSLEELAKRNLELDGFESGYSRIEFKNKIEIEGEIIGLESVWLKKDGTPIYVSENAKVIKDKNGKFLFYEGTVEDITERNLINNVLRESERKLREAQEMAHLGYWFWDVKTGNVEWSEEVYKIFRLNPKKFTPQIDSIMALSPWPEDNKRDKELINRAIENHEPGFYEQKFLRPDKSIGYYSSTFQGNYSEKGELISIVGAIMDITERKKADDKIRRLNEELEQRVIERTSQLEQSNKELEAFSYSVSHDLRAPLRGIDGFSLALYEDYFNKLDEKAKDYINRIRNSTLRMDKLIDSMLKLSRVTRFEIHYNKVNLSALAFEIVENIKIENKKRKSDFIIEENIFVEGDKYLLGILLENLLNNAWKFTSKNDKAVIELGTFKKDSETVYFVRDNGTGFDMKYYDKLFGAFQRLHSKKDYPGTGIGLATAQRIVHRHNGKIRAESEIDKGTTFYFTLK
jgi:PAS domain S-box-containing protein